MRIQHNIAALNSYRNLMGNNTSVGKNLEKLSSGYRINRAGDDAAGLAISEKMRSQIKGLETAVKNSNDAISLVQTAEGALTEVHSMMNRMVELATQSANGIYDDDVDRAALQDEMNSLTTEIDRIADSTNFNKKNLLDGTLSSFGKATKSGVSVENIKTLKTGGAGAAEEAEPTVVKVNTPITDAAASTQGVADFDLKLDDIKGKKIKVGEHEVDLTAAKNETDVQNALQAALSGKQIGTDAEFASDGKSEAADKLIVEYASDKMTIKMGDSISNTKETEMNAAVKALEVTIPVGEDGAAKAEATPASVEAKFNTALTDADKIKIGGVETALIGKTHGGSAANAEDVKAALDLKKEDIAKALFVDADGNEAKAKDIEFEVSNDLKTITIKAGEGIKLTDAAAKTAPEIGATTGTPQTATVEATQAKEAVEGGGSLRLQIGDTNDDFNHIDVEVVDMHTLALGIAGADATGEKGISISNQTDAGNAIDKINTAINTVSSQRGKLGALQNRLEHTINNLNVNVENMTAAESRIRDVDMAKEMMAYTKNNILVQASQAMLAQANQVPQGVLQLLR